MSPQVYSKFSSWHIVLFVFFGYFGYAKFAYLWINGTIHYLRGGTWGSENSLIGLPHKPLHDSLSIKPSGQGGSDLHQIILGTDP